MDDYPLQHWVDISTV